MQTYLNHNIMGRFVFILLPSLHNIYNNTNLYKYTKTVYTLTQISILFKINLYSLITW
jgi:hypothetical protein